MKKIQSVTVITDSPETYTQAYLVLTKVLDHLDVRGVENASYSSTTIEEDKAGRNGYKFFDILDVMANVGLDYSAARKLIDALAEKNFYIEERW